MSQYNSLRWQDSAAARATKAPVLNIHTQQPRVLWSDNAAEVASSLLVNAPVHVHTSTQLSQADAVLDGVNQRFALVLDAQDQLVGILASRDLHGRKAVKKATELGVAHDELSVDYLMQPISRLPVITQTQLNRARVGDVVATLQKSGQDFLLVQHQGEMVAIVAALTIVERTGESVQIRHHTESFADIMYAIRHGEEIE